jgi:hypothetical protein
MKIHTFQWSFMRYKLARFVAIGYYLTTLYLGNEVPLRLYLSFQWWYFPKNSYLALSMHALQTA